jgi:septal ring factor EnvC (AmiA/AmiB activator)
VGFLAGNDVTTADNVICIGTDIQGQNVSNSCFIGNIFNQVSASGVPVLVNANHKLGTTTSSKRFKQDIKPTGTASEALYELTPVTFRYKKEIDPAGTSQFGLLAEEVEKVHADLVVYDKEGKPYSVRYDQVNAMLLNEFLKEHRKNEEQQATITQLKSTVAQQQKDFQAAVAQQQEEIADLVATVKEQASQIQRVSAQLELSRRVPQVVNNQ